MRCHVGESWCRINPSWNVLKLWNVEQFCWSLSVHSKYATTTCLRLEFATVFAMRLYKYQCNAPSYGLIAEKRYYPANEKVEHLHKVYWQNDYVSNTLPGAGDADVSKQSLFLRDLQSGQELIQEHTTSCSIQDRYETFFLPRLDARWTHSSTQPCRKPSPNAWCCMWDDTNTISLLTRANNDRNWLYSQGAMPRPCISSCSFYNSSNRQLLLLLFPCLLRLRETN